MFFFFFKQKTAYEIGTGDWSSDVCSSDLKLCLVHMAMANKGRSVTETKEDRYFKQIIQNKHGDRKSVV